MTTEQLRYFLSIAEGRSFTETAAKHYISQPAISSQISKLEKEFGASLFERTKNGTISLTRAGELVKQFAEDHLRRLDCLMNSIRLSDNPQKKLTVGILPNTGWDLASDAILIFQHEFPDVSVHLLEIFDSKAALADGVCDAAINFVLPNDVLSAQESSSFLTCTCVAKSTLKIIYSANLNPSKDCLTLEDLSRHTMFLPESKLCHDFFQQSTSALFREHNLSPPKFETSCSLDNALYLSSLGRGFTLVPSTADHLLRGRFQSIDTDLTHYLGVFYPSNAANPYLDAFCSILTSLTPNEL